MSIISVLIPVFNEDVRGLAEDLRKSVIESKSDIEVIFAEDTSDLKDRSKSNAEFIKKIDGFSYLIRDENLGYCENRNKLAESAQSEYLLFLDADVRLLNENFLKNWIEQIPSNIFLCGGNVYQSLIPKDPKQILKWKHGKKREEAAVYIRNMHPHQKFWASNFMVKKSLFLQVPFDRRSKNYGYNDTVYAYLLLKQKIPVKHIDNAVLNTGLIDNLDFIKRTKEAVRNLIFFEKQTYIQSDFRDFITLLSAEKKLKRLGLTGFAKKVLTALEKSLLTNLLSENPNLRNLDLFKLHRLLQERER